MRVPYAEVQLETTGAVHDPAEVRHAIATVRSAEATDVLVAVHGWNNDMNAARLLYERLADSLAAARDQSPAGEERLAVVGILWPSIAWADEGSVPGGGAALEDPEVAFTVDLLRRLENAQTAKRLAALVPRLNESGEARAEYLELLRSELPRPADQDEDPLPATLTQGDPETVFELAASDLGLSGDDGLAGEEETGGAASFGLPDFIDAARRLLNLATYYTMKDRAGSVGRTGISSVLASVQTEAFADRRPRLHLIGHSFGARAATAAVAATTATISSLTLLQAAFSHYGMASNWDGRNSNGVFEPVPRRLGGPLLVTFTSNDTAIGTAYALASRLARQVASGLGDETDPYGGLGRNGALKTSNTEWTDLGDVGTQYHFSHGHVLNARADAFIRNHGDVAGIQVAHAVLSAIRSSQPR